MFNTLKLSIEVLAEVLPEVLTDVAADITADVTSRTELVRTKLVAQVKIRQLKELKVLLVAVRY